MAKPSFHIQREYLYSPKELCEILGLTGDKVFKVSFELGYFSIWTTTDKENAVDGQDV